jgi:hypothetical protein
MGKNSCSQALGWSASMLQVSRGLVHPNLAKRQATMIICQMSSVVAWTVPLARIST